MRHGSGAAPGSSSSADSIISTKMQDAAPWRRVLRHNEEAANILATACPLRMAGGRGLPVSRPANFEFRRGIREALFRWLTFCLPAPVVERIGQRSARAGPG